MHTINIIVNTMASMETIKSVLLFRYSSIVSIMSIVEREIYIILYNIVWFLYVRTIFSDSIHSLDME